jgi:ribosome biogenesis protein Tsr3
MARAQDEWVVKKIPGSGVACGVVRYGATAVLRSALVLKGALHILKQADPTDVVLSKFQYLNLFVIVL